MNSVWNKEELSQQWKESIIVPSYKNSDKTECRFFKDITATNYVQILSNIFPQD